MGDIRSACDLARPKKCLPNGRVLCRLHTRCSRVSGGGQVLVFSRHLQRRRHSAEYFGLAFPALGIHAGMS